MVLHINDIINSPLNKPQQEMKAKDVFSTEPEWETQKAKFDNPDKPSKPKEKTSVIHIELQKEDTNGNSISIVADIENMNDLVIFNEVYKDYLPRKKKWLGIL